MIPPVSFYLICLLISCYLFPGYQYIPNDIDREEEAPSSLTVLMDIKQILHNTLAPKWARLYEIDEQNLQQYHELKDKDNVVFRGK